MKGPSLHLNLLRESEKVSSSPVRMRVMLPVIGGLICVAMLIWWLGLFLQLMLVRNQIESVKTALADSQNAHSEILAEMERSRDLRAELDQLQSYAKARKVWGGCLAELAEVVPEDVQLTSLIVPEPPAQNLTNPRGAKFPPLLGPTGTVDHVSMRIVGRAPTAKPVSTLMDELATPRFSKSLVVEKKGATSSPRIKPISMEKTPDASGKRMLVFDIEYRCPERRFEK